MYRGLSIAVAAVALLATSALAQTTSAPMRQDVEVVLNRSSQPPALARSDTGLAPPLRQDVEIRLNGPTTPPPLVRSDAGLSPPLRQDVEVTLNRRSEAAR